MGLPARATLCILLTVARRDICELTLKCGS